LDLPRPADGAGALSDRDVLGRNTILWIFAVLWIVWGYLIQDPAPDPWSAATRNAFTVIASLVIVAVSIALVIAWVKALRRRRGSGAATH
jgi:hypothetical protein